MDLRNYSIILIFMSIMAIFCSGCTGQDDTQVTYEYSFQLKSSELKVVFFQNGFCDLTYLYDGKEENLHLKYERKVFGDDLSDSDYERIMEDHRFILPASYQEFLKKEYIKINYFDDIFIFIDTDKPKTNNGPQHFKLYQYYYSGFVGGIPSESSVITTPDSEISSEFYYSENDYRDIAIEYVHYDARGNDHYNLNDEYVIISNTGDMQVNLKGWYIQDANYRGYEFGSIILNPGSSLALCSGFGDDSDDVLYWRSEYAIWTNEGDTASLYNRKGELIDQFAW